MKRYVIKTLGCKANLADSQNLEAALLQKGWLPSSARLGETDSEVELCIVNSCTVTDEADRQSRRLASRLARTMPSAKVVMTGCAAEVDPERLLQSKGVQYVVGNQDKPRLVELILNAIQKKELSPATDSPQVLGGVVPYSELLSRHPMDREWPAVEPALDREQGGARLNSHTTRAFLKIQEGCNSFCTYCIIPYGRGPSRSLTPDQLVEQIRVRVAAGVREVVLTGTNIGDYGVDWVSDDGVRGGVTAPCALTQLCEAILKETSLERLRLSSLDPVEITPSLLGLMERESPSRLCPHFHVSLQSPLTKILRLMKRKYTGEHVRACLEAIQKMGERRPDWVGGCFVGMDVITGFPGESDRDFEESVQVLKSLPWSRLHVFPYSERDGTPATRLPGSVPPQVRVERARILNQLSVARMQELARQLVENAKPLVGVLMEGLTRGNQFGHSNNYWRVAKQGVWDPNSVQSALPLDFATDFASNEVTLICR